jgi:glycine hydroxymethyltransferase
MSDFLFRGDLEDIDPAVYELTQIEAERQFRKLIMIPSESAAPAAVRAALGSAYQNVYAEGYPPEETRRMDESEILDFDSRLAAYRRYSDPRYYKGVEYADAIEALARRRCAEAFATNGLSPDDLYVNVQALSGAPANNAVYNALIKPGDTILGMSLLYGGHLTHGSSVNRSGQLYNPVHYTVDPETEQLDFDQIATLAEEHKPKIIIAGYSSYPWQVDWGRFREIADSVGAFLFADIAHVAGLVAAGVYPSPVGIADVITFTTHKSLCGPRGAVILTASKSIARKVDRAVFPGEQGGPHIQKMAGQAVAFKLAQTEQFKKLQKAVVENCITFTETLEEAGFRIPYGGTNTHLMNLDCASVVGADGTTLSGDQAARILDIAGVVVNRNTIPGDKSAVDPDGIRMGTSWITQRGFGKGEVKELAGHIADLLRVCEPYGYAGRKSTLRRSKVDFDVLEDVKMKVRDLALKAGIDFEPAEHGYPHFYYLDDAVPDAAFLTVELEGEEVEDFIRWTTSARPLEIDPGESQIVKLGLDEGSINAAVTRPKDSNIWALTIPGASAARILAWLRALSDGYVTVLEDDIDLKIPGPVVVRVTGGVDSLPESKVEADGSDKPWYLRMEEASGDPLPAFTWDEPEDPPVKKTALNETHREMGAKMVPFAGWDMPVWYSGVLEEHNATRQAAGLFDVSHMGVYQVAGAEACAFLNSVLTNDAAALDVGESLYAQFLDATGHVIDDTMVYRYRPETFLVVVNASNDDKDWTWLNAVKDGKVRVDEDRPWAKAFGRDCTLRNLRDPKEGEDMRVDIALQGPRSREILLAMGCDESTAAKLKVMPWAGIMEGEFGGFDLIVSRTGYTGERVAYELFVHPEKSVGLWKKLLEVGEPFGLLPIGLGARDSLRTEAGLPLYGHEMNGDRDLGVGHAGFAAYVKTYKPWFIGRKAYLQQEVERDSVVVRFRFNDKGVRMAHTGDPVVDTRGKVVGFVTSCAVDSEGYLLGQALVDLKLAEEDTPVEVFQSAAKKAGKAPAELDLGDRTPIPTPATVLSRFP